MPDRCHPAPLARPLGRQAAALLICLSVLAGALGAPAALGHSAPTHLRPTAKTLSAARPATPADWQPGRLIVQLCPGTRLVLAGPGVAAIAGTDGGLGAVLARWGLTRAEALDAGSGLYRLWAASPGLDVAGAVAALGATAGVTYAEPDYRLRPAFAPSDPLFSRQWYLDQISAPAAWDITTGKPSVVVAMVDTGVAANHPDLAGRLVPGYNFVAGSTNTADDNGHGTYTAGLVAAIGDNNLGVAGVAWNARVMPIKILDKDGAGNVGDFARGIHYAVDHGARVINISAGIEYPAVSMHAAVQYAHSHGVVVIASAGNTPDGTARYPAGFEEVIAVSATDENDQIASFSSYGSFVDLAAPGVNMISTGWAPGLLGYEWASGTSSSAPLVSGAAALLLSVQPNLSAAGVQTLLEEGADDEGKPGWDPYYGAGRLNIVHALQLATGGSPTAVPAPPTAPRPTATAAPPVPTSPPGTAVPVAGLVLNPAHGAPGSSIVVHGHGYSGGELIGLRVTGPEGRNHELGTAQAAADGTFSQAIAIPPDLGPGIGTMMALGATSNVLASAPLGVDAAVQPAATPTATPGAVTGSRIEGTISGGPLDQVQVYLQVGNGLRDWRYGSPNSAGFYHFDNLPAGTYTVGLNAKNGLAVPPPVALEVDGQPATVRVVNFDLSGNASGSGSGGPVVEPPAGPPDANPAARFAPAADPAQAGVQFFPRVQHTLRGPFLAYWQAHGGLPVFGYPLSEEFVELSATDGKPYRVQYFERNRFEYHPEYAGTPSAVLLGLLGRTLTAGRSFPAATDTTSDADQLYFAQTGHRLGGAFLAYWRAHGGLAIFGYPISEELQETSPTDGKVYTVQYFERNRFELHPEYAGTSSEVLLGLLGVDVARARGFLH